ncbi:MAG: methyltransferase domain-containing protein [Acidimicrobiales bacterium]|nr:methyltransferase domain-containing protein [Acidimicrobiales bacterium]
MTTGEFTQLAMTHRLPKAKLVDRLEYLTDKARGRSVIHVGFVDSGCRSMNQEAGAWLHAHLASSATKLIGLDIDEAGVKEATDAGYEAYAVDCRDREAIAAAGIEPAQLVIAGEVIEHLDDPGSFLSGLHNLVAPGGELIITTPNAYGLFNVFASLSRTEINHPDHVVMFTWRTLTNLAARHDWEPVETRMYVPSVKEFGGRGLKARLLGLAGRVAVAIEHMLGRMGRVYAADGMIITFRSVR